MKNLITLLKIFYNLFSWLFLLAVLLVVFFTLSSNSNLFSGCRSFLVQSGSMEPSIFMGDIVVIHQQNQYFKNDTVTFLSQDQRIVTHRIVNVLEKEGKISFITKGDANRTEDEEEMTVDQILGKVIFVVPKLGYFVAFTKSLPGLILLILLPSFALIINELLKMRHV
jgi:signal peptidase